LPAPRPTSDAEAEGEAPAAIVGEADGAAADDCGDGDAPPAFGETETVADFEVDEVSEFVGEFEGVPLGVPEMVGVLDIVPPMDIEGVVEAVGVAVIEGVALAVGVAVTPDGAHASVAPEPLAT